MNFAVPQEITEEAASVRTHCCCKFWQGDNLLRYIVCCWQRLQAQMAGVWGGPGSAAKLDKLDRAMHRLRAAAYGRLGSRNLDTLFKVRISKM